MSKAWTHIPAGDVDSESVVTQDTAEAHLNNQECLISQPIDTRFAQADTSGSPSSYTTLVTLPIFYGPCVNTNKGDVTLVIRFEAWTDASTTIAVEMTLGAGTPVEVTGITATTPTYQTLTISSTDVKANADAEVNLVVKAKVTAGAGEAHVRCISASSRLERAA